MGFYEIYKGFFDAFKTKMEEIEALKQVVLGERFKLANLPLAIINPTETMISQEHIGSKLRLTVSFDVILVIRETEPEDWFENILTVMASVVDKVLQDRTVNEKCKDIIPVRFMPGEVRFADKMYYGGLIEFRALIFYSP